MSIKSLTRQLRQPWSRYGVSRDRGRSARLRLNITISHEVRAQGNGLVCGKHLFFWRRTRVRLAKLVSRLAVGILPLPNEFFDERCHAGVLVSARKRWNAAATEHLTGRLP